MATMSNWHKSLDERVAFLESPEGWDYLYSCNGSPTVKLDFEGDPHTWSQVKQSATNLGIEPTELVRFALYQYFEGPSNSAGARSRLLAHREWYRTRPVWVIDKRGVHQEPADQLHEVLCAKTEPTAS